MSSSLERELHPGPELTSTRDLSIKPAALPRAYDPAALLNLNRRVLLSSTVMGSYSFASPELRLPAPAVGAAISASSYSLRASPRGAAAWYETSEVQQQAALQPTERKGLREDTRGADAVAAGPRRAPCRSAGGCRAEHLTIASADIARERKRAKPGPLTLSRHRRLTRATIDLES